MVATSEDRTPRIKSPLVMAHIFCLNKMEVNDFSVRILPKEINPMAEANEELTCDSHGASEHCVNGHCQECVGQCVCGNCLRCYGDNGGECGACN